nr:MAG TPA: hypothetical protein [Bacteriophage sp.]
MPCILDTSIDIISFKDAMIPEFPLQGSRYADY